MVKDNNREVIHTCCSILREKAIGTPKAEQKEIKIWKKLLGVHPTQKRVRQFQKTCETFTKVDTTDYYLEFNPFPLGYVRII